MQVKLITEMDEEEFENVINKFCSSHEVIDIKYQDRQYQYSALILYKIADSERR